MRRHWWVKFIAQLLINDTRRWNSQGKLCGKRAVFVSRGDNEALSDVVVIITNEFRESVDLIVWTRASKFFNSIEPIHPWRGVKVRELNHQSQLCGEHMFLRGSRYTFLITHHDSACECIQTRLIASNMQCVSERKRKQILFHVSRRRLESSFRWTYCMPSLLAPTRDETWVQTLHDIALVMEKNNLQRPSDAFLSIALCKPSRIPTWPSDHCEVKTALVNKRNFVSTAVACVHF